ncbi:MAG: PBP1A family penicillin-binding protein, partial [Bacillota bacterium]
MSEKRRDNAGRKSKRPRKKTFNLFRIFFVLLMATVIIGIGVGAGFVVGAVRAMPQIEDIRPQAQETSYVYDNRGEILAPLRGTEHRIMVDLEDIPQEVVDAFIAIEDHRFYDHFGVDLYRIAGAAWSNLTTDGLQGASTITQQLARNAWPIGMEQTWSRKIQEAILALQLERAYHKDQILEMYLNQINLGHGAYGVQAAAGIYFDKDISEVNLEEAALLAAIPKSPEGYSPYKHRAAARNRRNEVLEAMEYHGFIDESVRSGTEAKPIALAGLPEVTQSAAPSFMDYVINELLERYDSQTVYGGGLKIYTTLDLKAQSYIDEAVATHLDENFPLGEFEKDLQTAIVIMDHQTGDILAMKGGRQHHDAREHNRVSQSYRQPGSAMKPILPYSLALEEGWTTASIIDDAPKEFSSGSGRFVPKNYSQSGWPMGVYYGLTTLREAIRRSVNLPAVRTLEALGVGKGPDWVEKFGITSLVRSGGQSDGGLAMALGGLTQGVSPLELTGAYSTFPGGGSRVEPMAITRVEDRHGNVLEDNSPTRHVVMSQQNAYIMTDILRSVVHDTRGGWLNNTGTGWRAKLENDWPAAGKTGTTDDSADLWWVGFTPRYIGAVWLGFDEPDSIPSIVGRSMPSGLFPVQIWKDIMDNLHRDMEPEDFPKPDGIVERTVCIKSGKLPGPDCPTNLQRREIFALGTEPRETCDIHVEMEVCSEHPNLLWDPECVENGEPEMKVFLEREELEPVTDTRGRTLPLPLDMEDIPPEEYCTDVYGTRPEEPSEGEDEEIRWEVTESARVSVDRNGFDPIVVRVPFEAEIEFEIAATGDTDHRIVIDG